MDIGTIKQLEARRLFRGASCPILTRRPIAYIDFKHVQALTQFIKTFITELLAYLCKLFGEAHVLTVH
jgi:hypothetical protein